jgi:dTDP-glucose 4,6-dehydratase
MKLLITGGAGFIGSAFVRNTVAAHPEDEITVLDKLTYAGNRANLDPVAGRVKFVQGDIADTEVVDELAKDCEVIVNFAAESHVDRSLEAPGQFIQTDVYGTYVLMEAARRHGHKKFLQVSTDEVYGEVETGSSDENYPLSPRSPYSASKAGGEMLVWAYRASYDFPAIITRGSNTYGHYQYPEKIIPLFITNAIDDKPLPIYGNGQALRDYIFVDDHVSGIDTALRQGKPGETYNVGYGGETSGIEVADAIIKALDKPDTLKQYVKDRLGHDRRYSVDSTKLRGLGWKPATSFEQGIKTTVEWYVANQEWWRPLKSGEFWEFYKRNYQPATPV